MPLLPTVRAQEIGWELSLREFWIFRIATSQASIHYVVRLPQIHENVFRTMYLKITPIKLKIHLMNSMTWKFNNNLKFNDSIIWKCNETWKKFKKYILLEKFYWKSFLLKNSTNFQFSNKYYKTELNFWLLAVLLSILADLLDTFSKHIGPKWVKTNHLN